jgi:hypothetical protein
MLTSATTVAASRVVVAPRASAAKKASRAQFGAVRGFDPLRYVSVVARLDSRRRWFFSTTRR